jgi:hypothetical protein
MLCGVSSRGVMNAKFEMKLRVQAISMGENFRKTV